MPTIDAEKDGILAEIQLQNGRLKRTRRLRLACIYSSAIILLASGGLSIVTQIGWLPRFIPSNVSDPNVLVWPLASGVFLIIASLLFDVSPIRTRKSQLETRINALESLASIEESFKFFGEAGQAALSMLDEFFEIVQQEYRQSSKILHISTVVSFLLITGGCAAAFSMGEARGKEFIALVSSASGVLTMLIAQTFYRFHRRESSMLSDYQTRAQNLMHLLLLFNLTASQEEQAKGPIIDRVCDAILQKFTADVRPLGAAPAS